jgi:hypothetical protein
MSAQDIKVQKVPITLDKERHLAFDLNAFCELEERFGTIQAAFDALQKGSVKTIRSMLYVGLLHEDESITEKYVGSLVSISNIQEIAKKIAEAITANLPQEKN